MPATQDSIAVNGNSETVVENGTNGATPKVKSGMECDIKNLYQGQPDNRNRVTWTDKYPDDLQDPAENEITARYAILIRHEKCYTDSRRSLQIHSIVIQSPLLKKVLGTVLENYPGVTTSLARLTFNAPFHPFVHRWEQFTKALDQQEDETTKEHLSLLYKVLKDELKETLASVIDFIANRVITYEHLWAIFQPSCTVYRTDNGRDYALKFTQGNYVRDGYQLACQGIDWDGEKFGYAVSHPLVYPFAGTKAITELECFPLEFHPKREHVTESLIARGKLFEKFSGYHYKAYKGTALALNPCNMLVKVHVDSRIIVDRYAWGRFNPNQNNKLQPLESHSHEDHEDDEDYEDDEDEYDSQDGNGDEDVYIPNRNHQVVGTLPNGKKHAKHGSLTKEQLTLCTPLVKGYALKTKKWLHFFVDSIIEIAWNEDAFKSLVLPEDQKELVLAYAESQREYKEKFDDFVSGKGKGIIMLLSGPPGVGKTLTAESVAEHMRVPLYMMGASDLGYSSSQVEGALTTVLEMVAKWNAVLLIDECDVFLEARNSDNLDRNKMVSIFLRTLEYYEGILFLTTNRLDNIDTAFQSRIHVSIEYEPLNKTSRRHVWSNFLSRDIEHELTGAQIDELAEVDINGRQIKNILKTSQLLACRKKTPLRYEYIKTVLSI